MRKNVSGQTIGAQLISTSDGAAFTGAVTVAVTLDAGVQATGSVGAGACVHEGNGYHTYAPAQAETNGDLAAFTFTGAGAVPVTVQVYTTSLNPHDTVRGGLTALPAAAADAAGGLPISDAGGLDLDAQRSDVAAILVDTGTTLQAELDGIQADTENLQTRVPAALVGGRIDSSVGAMAANVLTAAAAAADLTTELQSGLATAAAIAALDTKIGAPAGASVSADVAAVKTDTGNLVTRITSTLFSGITSMAQWLGLIAGKQTGNSTARTELRATGAGSGTFDETTASQEALRDRGDAAWATATGFSTQTSVDDLPTNSELATALGTADDAILAAIAALNNLSSAAAQTAAAAALTAYDPPTNAELEARTLLAASYATAANQSTIAGYIDTEVAAIVSAIAALNNISTADVLTQVNAALQATLADSIPADGTRPSISSGVYMLVQFMLDRSVSGTTCTVRKPDGSTSLFTLTLNDAAAPTSITRGS